jgi:hypothetical protein
MRERFNAIDQSRNPPPPTKTIVFNGVMHLLLEPTRHHLTSPSGTIGIGNPACSRTHLENKISAANFNFLSQVIGEQIPIIS